MNQRRDKDRARIAALQKAMRLRQQQEVQRKALLMDNGRLVAALADQQDEVARLEGDLPTWDSVTDLLHNCYLALLLYNNNVASPADYATVRSTYGVPAATALQSAFPSYPDVGLSDSYQIGGTRG
jgi:hypothetical protein